MSQTIENGLVVGHQIQIDLSGGQGHCWKNISAEEMGADQAEQIAGEILDGGMEACEDIVICGQHFRWS